MDVLGLDAREHLVDFQIDDAQQLRFSERMKNDDLVEPVQKLRFKHALRFIENLVPHRIVIVSFKRRAKTHHGLLFEQVGPDVGRHNDDCISEIDLAPE